MHVQAAAADAPRQSPARRTIQSLVSALRTVTRSAPRPHRRRHTRPESDQDGLELAATKSKYRRTNLDVSKSVPDLSADFMHTQTLKICCLKKIPRIKGLTAELGRTLGLRFEAFLDLEKHDSVRSLGSLKGRGSGLWASPRSRPCHVHI